MYILENVFDKNPYQLKAKYTMYKHEVFICIKVKK